MRRDFDMRYALVWESYGYVCRPYEKWLEKQFGVSWYTHNPHWKSGYGSNSSRGDRPTFYVAVKEKSTLTMMFLALGDTNE